MDALILASSPLADVRIAGLSARERAIRVARRVGATKIDVVDRLEPRPGALLIIRADQLVHTPLVQPLVAHGGTAIAVGPDGAYAGAILLADGSAATGDDAALAATIAAKVPHGEIARAPIATPDERKAAHKLLYRILIKPQDNAITRYLYRPVSFPLTKLLAHTPITPNQISVLVAIFVALGCYLTAHASHLYAFLGTATVLFASYLDCCDGEIARLKLLSSKIGAWLDTIVDECSSIGYMAALGIHCHLAYGDIGQLDVWLDGVIIGVITYGASIYFVYYNIIVGVGSANSQDYAGRFDVVPGSREGTVRLVPAAAKAIAPTKPLPPWLQFVATYAPYIVRRDFISWGATVLAALALTHVSFGIQVLGGVVTAVICLVDHVRLRALRRRVRASGQILEAPSR